MTVVRLLDQLEGAAEGYLTLEEAQRAAGQDLARLIAEGVLLVDYRQRLEPSGEVRSVTLCRLNRHHPAVRRAGGD
jgi:hypothetical protein